MHKSSLRGILAGTIFMLGAGHQASADVVFATGFEPPNYTTGALAGQNGWFGNTGQVETSTVFAGSQAVGYDSTGLSGQLADDHLVSAAGQGSFMVASGEVFVSGPDSHVLWDGIAIFGNSTFLGQVLFGGNTATFGGPSSVFGSIAFTTGVWHKDEIDVDFATDTESAYLDGVLIGSGSFSASNTEVTLLGMGINGADGSATTQAYVDDVGVAAIPEPSSLAMLGIGLLGFGALACARATPRARKPSAAS